MASISRINILISFINFYHLFKIFLFYNSEIFRNKENEFFNKVTNKIYFVEVKKEIAI